MCAIQILSVEPDGVSEGYLSGVQSLLAEAFDDNEAIDFPPEPHTKVLAVTAEDQVVGHLAAYVREVDFEGGSKWIGMIGDVATSVSFRRQGIVKGMVETAHSLFLNLGVEYSILFAYIPTVYKSSGYELMKNKVHFLDEDGLWKTLVYRGSMFCELTGKKWPKGLLNLRGRAV